MSKKTVIKKLCTVVVPIYKTNLTDDEKASFIQLRKILGNNWDVSLVCPEYLDVTEYEELWTINRKLRVERFQKRWFESQSSYAKFMTLPLLYNRFKEYEYMLIYQLDAWIFRDELHQWLSKDYDYIGAPFLSFKHMIEERRCENGGFCLRRIPSFLKYIRRNNDAFLPDRYWDDGYYCWNYGDVLKIAPLRDAVLFSLETTPDRYYEVTKKLPFGCHAWRKYNYKFWSQVIIPEDNLKEIKNKDIQIFCFSHKIPEVSLVDDYYHTPVEVGSALREEHFGKLLDNEGDNISDQNPYWRELTGMYYLWKNIHDVKYIGLEHYGRRWNLPIKDVLSGFEGGAIEVIAHPMKFETTIKEHYKNCHSESDFNVMESVVKELYPEYTEDFDKFINNGKTLLSNNNYIMSKANYDKMCEFVFSILVEILNRLGVFSLEEAKSHAEQFCVKGSPYGNWIDYQAAFPGFMAERLTSLWCLHNFKTIKVAEYKELKNE